MIQVKVMGKNIDSRRDIILSMVNEYGSLDFQQLRDAFPNVSDVTLRKDLQYLNDTQQAIRTHGGIKSIPSFLNYYYRSNINPDLKKTIASKAVKLIRPGDYIFVSAGTTCAQLASTLPSFPLSVCTDGIYTVNSISAQPHISVELLGGDVDLNIMRTEGISTLNRLDSLHFSTAFLGAIYVNDDFGFAHNSAMTSATLKKVIEHSDRTVVMVDSTKFNSTFCSHCIPFSMVDIVVSDDDLPEEMAEKLRSKGIEVI